MAAVRLVVGLVASVAATFGHVVVGVAIVFAIVVDVAVAVALAAVVVVVLHIQKLT